MLPKKILQQLLGLALSVMIFPSFALADGPREKPVDQIVRTAQMQDLLIRSELSKNFYRQEAYEAQYPVEVPYQDIEEYWENVPYEVEEPYTDWEDYIDQEYRCRKVTDYERVCRIERRCKTRTVYERECHQERKCHMEQGPPVCHNERVCQTVPGREVCRDVEECGTDAQGRRVCKMRRVCHKEPPTEQCRDVQKCVPGQSREVCRNENVCRDVPRQVEECNNEEVCHNVPREREVCGWENVTKRREVTKYRRVTKYRQEKRTRTVTKYRTEWRCCVTKYRDVYDHQNKLAVEIQMPAQSQLIGQEREILTLRWVNEQKSELSIESTIFKYRIISEEFRGGIYRYVLGLEPMYSDAELGSQTVDIKSMWTDDNARLLIRDLGLRPRVTTKYQFQVKETASGTVVEQGEVTNNSQENYELNLKRFAFDDMSYSVDLKITRDGIVLSRPISFMKSLVLPALSSKESFGEKSIRGLKLNINGNANGFLYEDLVQLKGVKTALSYTIYEVATQKLVEEGQANYEMQKVINVALKNVYNKEMDYLLQVRIRRQSDRIREPIDFTIKTNFQGDVFDPKPFQDVNLVKNFSVVGVGAAAQLNFEDITPKNKGVETSFLITINRKSGVLGKWKELAKKSFQINKQQNIQSFSLSKDFAVSESDLKKYLAAGKEIQVQVEITRTHVKLNGGQPVILKKEETLKVK